jgi:predicted aminopeptidase
MALILSGCQAVGYYRQAVAGEYQILAHQKPVDSLIADPATPPKLKAKLQEALKIREFAAQELKEPADGNYVKYTDLHRPCVVWTVVVAPALSLEPKIWWFPIVGRASYRGYFSEAAARRYAEKLEKRGWDVEVGGVQTYSTLGWFHDPLLNTFIDEPESGLAEIIFHELAHRRLFVPGDTDFNEAFATTVAEEGVRRWYLAAHKPKDYEDYLADRGHESDFVKLVLSTRDQLQSVYSDARLPDAEKLRRKADVIREMRDNYAILKARWGVAKSGYDNWFSEPINNAKLNTIAVYNDLVPGFQAVLRAQGGDIEKFYQAVGALAKMPVDKRRQALAKASEVPQP